MLRAWRPYRTVGDGKTATICAYYPAENALYHAAGEFCRGLADDGRYAERLVGDVIPVRRILTDAKIAAIGENGLCATRSLGSYFAVQLVATDAFLPEGSETDPAECLHCGNCRKACPCGALPMDDPKKCLRWWLDGQEMPDWAMKGMRRLFGCELCQLACPRNASFPAIEMPKTLYGALNYGRLLAMDREERLELAALVGKNLLTRGRVQAQSLVLADRERLCVEIVAESLMHEEKEAPKSAAKYVLSKHGRS